jgi:hypothetical protein
LQQDRYLFAFPYRSARPAFRRINRREIAGLVGIADTPKFLKHLPWLILGWPHDLNFSSRKLQKLQKLQKTLWDQEKSCWEGPV